MDALPGQFGRVDRRDGRQRCGNPVQFAKGARLVYVTAGLKQRCPFQLIDRGGGNDHPPGFEIKIDFDRCPHRLTAHPRRHEGPFLDDVHRLVGELRPRESDDQPFDKPAFGIRVDCHAGFSARQALLRQRERENGIDSLDDLN